MSCKENQRWYPVEYDQVNDALILAENQFYEKNSSKIFTKQEDCIFGSGGKSSVVTINGNYPGETIEVVEGALVHVKVINKLYGGVSPVIHFHGFKFDNGYYWYDGVKDITQCPIPNNQFFTYSFIASEIGTRWYHGHGSGVKLDGLYGAIIVHPKNKPVGPAPNVFLVADYISSSIHGSTSTMKVSSAYHVDGGSAEVIFSPNGDKRLYFEDNVPVSDFVIDGVYINGRDATNQNVRFPNFPLKVTSVR